MELAGRGRDAVIDDISFKHIEMRNVMTPFVVNSFYFCDPDGHTDYVQDQKPAPVNEMTPAIGTISGRGINCTGASACVLCAVGLPESPIGKLDFEDITVSFLPEGERVPERPVMMDNFDEMSGRSIYAKNVRELVLENVEIIGAADEEAELINVENRSFENVKYM